MVILELHSLNTDLLIPLCMVFHGNESNVQDHAEYWRPVTDMGWFVALPQSTYAGEKHGAYIWNTPGRAECNFEACQQRSLGFIQSA